VRRRRVAYVTGTRADFGPAESILHAIHTDPRLELSLIISGEHLCERHGRTEQVVRESGFPIGARLETLMASDSRAAMAAGIGVAIIGFTQAIEAIDPDVVMVLGDRGEMLAAAIVGSHLRKFVAHVHGGELSGTIDGSVRHAISKFAHLHYAATRGAAQRLVGMGEDPETVFVVGAPGLDGIQAAHTVDRISLSQRYGLEPSEPWALVIYHPDVLSDSADAEFTAVLEGLSHYEGQLVMFTPNSDAGRDGIARQVREHTRARVVRVTSVPRADYLALLAGAEFMIGNSSSGIIEAPGLGVPFICVGHRQDGRERGCNVLDVPPIPAAIAAAVKKATVDMEFRGRVAAAENPYGDGASGQRIADLLATAVLDPMRLQKRFQQV
jgi:GDP/UDP-N,N'-diacetylbacillosamine 2-epimerase (hydrolysing)